MCRAPMWQSRTTPIRGKRFEGSLPLKIRLPLHMLAIFFKPEGLRPRHQGANGPELRKDREKSSFGLGSVKLSVSYLHS